jgi:Secretion system C-terminal sorting domain
MIIGYVCSDSSYFDEANSFMVVIKTNHWPINISWDKSLFLESCNKLQIIDCTAGAWFDVCGGGHPYLLLEMNQSDTASYYDTEFKIETGEDTLSVLFFSFFNDIWSSVSGEIIKKKIRVFPNPTNESVYLDYPIASDDKIIITDISGRTIPFILSNQLLDLKDAPEGIYILTITLHTGETVATKIFKTK